MVVRKMIDLIDGDYPGDDHAHVQLRHCLELDADDALAGLPLDDDPTLCLSRPTLSWWADAFVFWSRQCLIPVPADLRVLLGIVEPEIPMRTTSEAVMACVLREAEPWLTAAVSRPCAFPPFEASSSLVPTAPLARMRHVT
jgi:hypothetical protein